MPQSGTGVGSGGSAPHAPNKAMAAATCIVVFKLTRKIMFPPTWRSG
jgi:hypothetical protein